MVSCTYLGCLLCLPGLRAGSVRGRERGGFCRLCMFWMREILFSLRMALLGRTETSSCVVEGEWHIISARVVRFALKKI